MNKVTLMVPPFCYNHMRLLVVEHLGVPETGPWRATVVVANSLIFQIVTHEGRIYKEREFQSQPETPKTLNKVMKRIGCLACYSPTAYQRTVRICKQGLSYAAKVTQAKVYDPDGPWKPDQVKPDA